MASMDRRQEEQSVLAPPGAGVVPPCVVCSCVGGSCVWSCVVSGGDCVDPALLQSALHKLESQLQNCVVYGSNKYKNGW